MNDLWRQAKAWFRTRTPREQALVSAAGALLGIGIVYLGSVSISTPDAGAELRLDAAEQRLAIMTRERQKYDDVQRRLRRVEQGIASGPRGKLVSTLEGLAKYASIKIESIQPQASPSNESYRETKVEVALASVSLAQAVTYLHQIEASDQILSIKSLRLRVRSDAPELLDVRFTVSSFEPI